MRISQYKLPIHNQIFVVYKTKAAVDDAYVLVQNRASHHPIFYINLKRSAQFLCSQLLKQTNQKHNLRTSY